jgi:hypothetical protein
LAILTPGKVLYLAVRSTRMCAAGKTTYLGLEC